MHPCTLYAYIKCVGLLLCVTHCARLCALESFKLKHPHTARMDDGRDSSWDDHNRRLVLEGRQVLERTSASLARSNQIAIETEHIGTEVSFLATFSHTTR